MPPLGPSDNRRPQAGSRLHRRGSVPGPVGGSRARCPRSRLARGQGRRLGNHEHPEPRSGSPPRFATLLHQEEGCRGVSPRGHLAGGSGRFDRSDSRRTRAPDSLRNRPRTNRIGRGRPSRWCAPARRRRATARPLARWWLPRRCGATSSLPGCGPSWATVGCGSGRSTGYSSQRLRRSSISRTS